MWLFYALKNIYCHHMKLLKNSLIAKLMFTYNKMAVYDRKAFLLPKLFN